MRAIPTIMLALALGCAPGCASEARPPALEAGPAPDVPSVPPEDVATDDTAPPDVPTDHGHDAGATDDVTDASDATDAADAADARGDGAACVDTDGDGIADDLEGAPLLRTSLRRDASPDFQNIDSDDDGVLDAAEAQRSYRGYEARALPALACGATPDDCDGDLFPNHRDRDADNDGLVDREEVERWRTDPCRADTDGDGVTDLLESAAASDPLRATSRPPAGSIYVTLPYRDPRGHQHREFTFRTRIRSADVMFLVDTSGSMRPTIDAVRATLSSTIVPGIVAALGGATADVRYGLADHRDFAEGGNAGDYALQVLQRLDPSAALSQAATLRLAASGGEDEPEAQVPAMHALISGVGQWAYRGTASRNVTAADCGGDATAYGWGCFRPGRVPIVVLFSDAPWHNGPAAPTNFYGSVPGAATFSQLVTEMTRREAFFIGIDVGAGFTYASSVALARATRTLDAMGNPVAFQGAAEMVATNVVRAVTALASGARQDVTRRVDADPTERRLPAGRTTASFVHAVTPVRGTPTVPVGYVRLDATTFYGVAPSTVVTFDVDLYNDFHRNTSGVVQLFQATLTVLGRASSALDANPVFVVVPAEADTLPL